MLDAKTRDLAFLYNESGSWSAIARFIVELSSVLGASDWDCMTSAGPDAPVNPCIYFVGQYDPEHYKFDLEGAKGPFRWQSVHLVEHSSPCTLFSSSLSMASQNYI